LNTAFPDGVWERGVTEFGNERLRASIAPSAGLGASAILGGMILSKYDMIVSRLNPGAASLMENGVADPAEHFKEKKIQASGEVKEVDKVPRIEIDEAKQIKLVEDK
jgi:hypothetical protein